MEFFKGVADFFVASFPFGLLNVFVLAFVIAIIVERFVFILMKYRVNSREFMAQIRKLVQAGNIDRAIKLCEAAPLPLLQVVKAGLSQVNRGEDAVISAMEERMAEVIPDLEKRIGSLWSLANIATLIGLLGTISGLIRTFQSMDLADKAEQAQKLSEGLAEAMHRARPRHRGVLHVLPPHPPRLGEAPQARHGALGDEAREPDREPQAGLSE
jgi:biopolymer transport protein ExbB/TolQ